MPDLIEVKYTFDHGDGPKSGHVAVEQIDTNEVGLHIIEPATDADPMTFYADPLQAVRIGQELISCGKAAYTPVPEE